METARGEDRKISQAVKPLNDLHFFRNSNSANSIEVYCRHTPFVSLRNDHSIFEGQTLRTLGETRSFQTW